MADPALVKQIDDWKKFAKWDTTFLPPHYKKLDALLQGGIEAKFKATPAGQAYWTAFEAYMAENMGKIVKEVIAYLDKWFGYALDKYENDVDPLMQVQAFDKQAAIWQPMRRWCKDLEEKFQKYDFNCNVLRSAPFCQFELLPTTTDQAIIDRGECMTELCFYQFLKFLILKLHSGY